MRTIGYAAYSSEAKMMPYHFERRALRDNDVAIEILYSGVCHSDLHTVNGDWGSQPYPLVPGHEIVGRVIEVGALVKKYKVGDNVAVGCMVDSCQDCDQCHDHEEQFCRHGMTATYGAPDRITDEITQGGYSKHIIVREEFVLNMPVDLDLSKSAPILCAGITTYSPLKHWGVTKGSRVAVIGLGGLGHMGVKLALALGAKVTVISRSDSKKEVVDALGAKGILVSKDSEAMRKATASFDFILDTIPTKHNVDIYTPLLDVNGALVLVGQVGPIDEVNVGTLIMGRRQIAGSLIGGIKETQEVLDFCAKHQIYPECKMIQPSEINEAFAHLAEGDVAYRFVMDMSALDNA
ncbi:NADP-dependent alcohol dehydrogenase C 2 [Providencia manganoxydans]|uniref:NAD(P)-dependent alcohol dehydrogenase n=1 Tax=Providencia manganoxydans TaxID=2923283 RepID=UPI003B9A8771